MISNQELKDIVLQYPKNLQQPQFVRSILREYLEISILEYISRSTSAEKLTFIGGTSLRLIHGIDRWSEDLDFDCKEFSKGEFDRLSDGIVRYLSNMGFDVARLPVNTEKLNAFRSVLNFPGLLQQLGLTGHPDERFKMKIEAQDQGVDYKAAAEEIQRANFQFKIRTAPVSTLLSMKLSAILSRSKGRDYYDALFLMRKTIPDFDFLDKKKGIADWSALDYAVEQELRATDLVKKTADFKHLLFAEEKAGRIQDFGQTFHAYCMKGKTPHTVV